MPRSALVIETLFEDAIAAHRDGDLTGAERGYRAVLDGTGGHVEALRRLGALYLEIGQPADAIALLRRAVALCPRDAALRTTLGLAAELTGDPEAAATHYARALECDPTLANAQFGLGLCHERAGRAEAAIACYRRAADLAPDHARARNNLANLLAARDPEAAAALLGEAIAIAPDYPEAHNNLGALWLSRGDAAAALAPLERAVALRPGYASALANLGLALRALDRGAEGLARLRAAEAAGPAAVPPRWMLAQALAEDGDGAAAEAVLRAALAIAPDNADTRVRLAQLLHQRGRFAESDALFTPLLAAGLRRGAAAYGLAQNRRFGTADRELVDAMRAVATDAALPAEERIALDFALGKVLDDLGDPATAMQHYDAGNAARRARLPAFDRAAHAAMVDRLIATWPAARLRAGYAEASASARPILIVGMMRSGTTLLEQMLAAHPAVASGGEFAFWATRGAGGEAAPSASLVAGYLAQLDAVSPDAARVTDKLPHNIYALGLFHLLFPRARILHCRRDAADTGLSLYRTLFRAPHAFAYDRGDIAFVLRAYQRLAAHWRAALPADAMMEVHYEALVTAPEATVRAALAFCGLAWDPRCLDHAAHARLIRSASGWQARQPLYRESVGAARRYAPWLGELAATATPPVTA